MKRTKIAIIGHYGSNVKNTDGQTVKIKSLVSAIKSTRPDIDLTIADTYYLLNNRMLYFLWLLLIAIIKNQHIIFFPSSRGRQYMFGFFYYVGKIFKKKLYHDCIAGSLDNELVEHPTWIKYLNGFEYNWMESPEQVKTLKEMGIKNVYYLPNFKNLQPAKLSETNLLDKEFRFCIFSRIMPQKGIVDALEAIQYVVKERKVDITLDIYGTIEQGYETWFDSIKNTYSDICNYAGVVHYEQSVATLKDYFALLFPTQFYTEGMPGTIIDAMFAGIPVIARKWKWCDNMIHNGYNGISYDFDKPELLKEILLDIVENPQRILNMKKNCIEESKKYSPELICQQIYNQMHI